MKGEWIKRPEGNTAVIFVHGILSDGETGWKNDNGCYWPSLLAAEKDLSSIGIYVFTYQTSVFSGNYSISDIADALKELMDIHVVSDCKKLIFVCHSMGGIVARKYLVDWSTELICVNKVIGLFLVASPSLGSAYADLFSKLAEYFNHSQAKALRLVKDNSWLMDLDKSFMNLKESNRLLIKGKELVEDKFVVLRKWYRTKVVVESFSGARYFAKPFKVPNSDHFSIAKPDKKDAIQNELLIAFVRNIISVPVGNVSVDVFDVERVTPAELKQAWDGVNEIMVDRLIGPDVDKAASAMTFTALAWNNNLLSRKIIYEARFADMELLFSRLADCEKIVPGYDDPGFERRAKDFISEDIRRCYEQMKYYKNGESK